MPFCRRNCEVRHIQHLKENAVRTDVTHLPGEKVERKLATKVKIYYSKAYPLCIENYLETGTYFSFYCNFDNIVHMF